MADLQQSAYIIGDQSTRKTLTGSYSAANSGVIPVNAAYQLALDIEYTMGSGETGNSLQVRIRFASPTADETPTVKPGFTSDYWNRQVSESTSSGTTTISLQEYTFDATQSAGTYDRFHLSIPVDAQWVEVAVKETGIDSNGGSCSVKATVLEEHS